jgi:superfamily II DNA or RNA helicase
MPWTTGGRARPSLRRTELLASGFPAAIRSRGRAYFLAGQVRITKGDSTGIEATVRGNRPYRVNLVDAGDGIRVACNCPHYLPSRSPCKHIWAALLAAEEEGHLPVPAVDAHTGAEFPDPAYIPPDEIDSEDDPYDEPHDEAPPPGLSWEDRLTRIARAGRPIAEPGDRSWPAGRELLYDIDVTASLEGRGLTVDVLQRQPRKGGGWSKPKAQKVSRQVARGVPDDADRRALAVLLGGLEDGSYAGMYESYGTPTSRYRLPEPLSPVVVPVLCATGRCRLRRRPDDVDPPHLAWDDGPAWELWLDVRRGPDGLTVEGGLRRGDEKRALQEPALMTAGGLVFFEDRAARLDHRGAFAWIVDLLRAPRLTVPDSEATRLIDALTSSRERPRVDLPPELAYEEEAVRPRPALTVKPLRNRWGVPGLECELSFEYGDHLLPEGATGWGVYQAEKRRVLVRDVEAERRAVERLRAVGVGRLIDRGQEVGDLQVNPDRLPEIVATLVPEGWRVEAEGRIFRSPGTARLRVSSGIDWFDLEGGVDFDGRTVPLPRLLAALKRGEKTVTLDDGSVGLLPEEWLRRQSLLADFGTTQGEVVRFRRSQAGLLDALLAAEPGVAVDASFARARERLREFEGVRPAEAPPGFVGSLRAYQHEGLGWLHFLREFGFGGCLADDMGLGKTVQVLALLEARRGVSTKPSLVVVPKSLVFNWRQEAARFTPALRLLDHTGVDRRREAAGLEDVDIVLTTYGTLRRDVLLFREVAFDYVVLDEAQAIKNHGTEAAKAARLLKADNRLALSGTPVENHLGELQSLFDFLNPGLLGRTQVLKKAKDVDDQVRGVLGHALRPFILRRTKGQVAADLPQKLEQTILCDLPAEQRALCDELRDHYRRVLLPRVERDGLPRSQMHVLEALLRLRQAACHPGLLDPKRAGEPSGKLDELLPRLLEVREEGHKALVFSQFTSFLALLRTRLDAAGVVYEYLDGKTRDRAARVRRFQEDPDCGVFLVSLKAGGVGLNLTAAEYVFLLDPWWNPAVEAQAIDRTHRIGQTRRVFAYRLIARGTVEEKVLALQDGKRKLADAILDADASGLKTLRKEDLERLLS